MIRIAAMAGVLALLLASALPVHAFSEVRIGQGGWLLAQQRQHSPQRERYGQPSRNERESRGSQGQQQRMTPDERRQLRRDLHDANRDLRPQRGDGRR